MAKVNEITIAANNGNSGVGRTFLDFKNIIGAILCPKGFEFDVTDPKTTLLAAVLAARSQRIFPFWDFETPKDGSEEKTVQTMSNGAKHPVREGFNDWSFQYVDGGLTLLSNARKFNGPGYDFLFVDSSMKIMGVTGSTSTKVKAIPSNGGFFWANPWKMNDSSKISEYMLQFVFNIIYSNDYVSFVQCDFDLPTVIKGLKNVKVVAAGTATPGTYNVTIKDEVGTNLADVYPTELASAAMYSVKNAVSLGVCTITSVTLGANALGEPCFVFAMLTSDTDYSGAANLLFDLVTPATLAAAGIDNYESLGASKVAKN